MAVVTLAPEDVRAIAVQVAAELAPVLVQTVEPDAAPDAWLDSSTAAKHLGISRHALHRLTSAREIPFSQDRPGGRCYFQRSALNEWRVRNSA